MKKILAITVSMIMAFSCLTACSEEKKQETETTRQTTTTAAATTTASSKTAYKDEVDLTYFFEQVYANGYAPEGTYEGTRVYDGGAGLCVEFHGKSKSGECISFSKGGTSTMKECYLLAAVMSDYQLSGRFYFPA